jgi:hypothetical protein
MGYSVVKGGQFAMGNMWLKAVSFTPKLVSVLWLGWVFTSAISIFHPSLFLTVSWAARILVNLCDPLVSTVVSWMRPGGYHRGVNHTEPSQGTAVARQCPPPPQITKCCVHITSHNRCPMGGSTITLNHMHGAGCLLSKPQYQLWFLYKRQTLSIFPISNCSPQTYPTPLNSVKNSVTPCISSSLLVWPDCTLTTMSISTHTNMQITYLPFCQMQNVPLKHHYTTRIHIFTPQTRVFTASVGDTQISVS